MPLSPSDSQFLHLYGMVNGLYLASFIYIFLFGVSYLLKPSHRRIGITFIIAACGYGCVGLYNLFFQYTHISVTEHFMSSAVFSLAKYAAPIAMAIINYIFIRLTVLKSYKAYRLVNKYKLLIYATYLNDLLCLIVLCFIDDLKLASFIILIAMIPHALAAAYYAYRIQKISAMIYSAALTCCILVLSWLTWLIYQNQLQLSPPIFFVLHLLLALFLLLFSFMTIRYGYEEAKRYYEIKALDSKHIINSIYRAIREKEFYLEYQPKVDLVTDKVCGVEALIRWKHRTLGNISPQEFIPLAEKTHLINHICRWTIEAAVKQARYLLDHNIKIPISLNFSAYNLTPRVVRFLGDMLETHYVPASSIVIEITESLLVDMTEEQNDALDMLYKLNIALSLDDYGSGFSSLNYINKLSLSELKIDRNFITDIETNTDHLVIVNSTLQMSQELNLKVVAEGVENERIMKVLTNLGCDIAQGYAISPPLPAADLHSWLTSSRYGHRGTA